MKSQQKKKEKLLLNHKIVIEINDKQTQKIKNICSQLNSKRWNIKSNI